MGSISTVIKDAFLSADVARFGFDKFDDGGVGFDELPESRLVPIEFSTKGNMPHVRKPLFIKAVLLGLAAIDWIKYGKLLGFWSSFEKVLLMDTI